MFITSIGLTCPVGLSASAATAAIRAGISGFVELPFHDQRHQAIVGARVPAKGLRTDCRCRLIDLLTSAVRDCLAGAPTLRTEKVPILVCLPEPTRPGAPDVASTVVSDISASLGRKFDSSFSATFPRGNSAAIVALKAAREVIRARKVEACLVCGVDSLLTLKTLVWLDETGRLKSPDQSDGLIPGEAAAAVLVEAKAQGHQTEIVGLGIGSEGATALNDEPLLGTGLAMSTRIALQESGIGIEKIDLRLADLNGESFGFREHALAYGRLMRIVRYEDQPLWHPAQSIGETGAASGVVLLTIAAAAWKKGVAPGEWAACFTTSVNGERASAVLRFKRPERN